MKRINNIFEQIISIENLMIADEKAQKGKSRTYGVEIHKKNRERNILKLHNMLISKTYKTSEYDIFKVYEPKERDVYRLPYFPDRICHHAIINVLEPIFVAVFTADSYSCIKGRGIHKASFNLRKSLINVEETTYCLKLDIKKFYPNRIVYIERYERLYVLAMQQGDIELAKKINDSLVKMLPPLEDGNKVDPKKLEASVYVMKLARKTGKILDKMVETGNMNLNGVFTEDAEFEEINPDEEIEEGDEY